MNLTLTESKIMVQSTIISMKCQNDISLMPMVQSLQNIMNYVDELEKKLEDKE